MNCRNVVFRLARLALGTGLLSMVDAAPPVTTIQDTLYKADGAPFNGLVLVNWKSFEGPDSSNIPTNSLTVQVVSGKLFVKLIPTTTSPTVAYYSVRYVSDGSVQFSELWSVPPSANPLRVRDVRIAWPPASPGAGGGAGTVTQVQMSDVVGLAGELNIRPTRGLAYAPSRAVVINGAGELEAAAGNLADCVRVDGTSGPCGTGGAGAPQGTIISFIDAETPTGVVDGINGNFTLAGSPNPPASLLLYRNGMLQKAGLDYSLNGNAIGFMGAATPQAGDILLASYRFGGPGGTGPLVLCNRTGASTGVASLTSLGTCLIAADVLQAGDRVEIRFDYSHEGTATGFSLEVRWGAQTLTSRSATASETLISGHTSAGVHQAGTQLNTQSWGTATATLQTVVTAADPLSAPLTVDFRGGMAGATSDTVTLRNLTVTRYPAQ